MAAHDGGLPRQVLLYRLSLNHIDRSNPLVIHFVLMFICVVFHKFTCHASLVFNYIMYYIVANILGLLSNCYLFCRPILKSIYHYLYCL